MARSPSTVADFATAAGSSVTEIPRKDGWRLLQSWREIYCAPFHEATGKWSAADGSSWHTFSNNHFPSIHGRRALNEYFAQIATALLVLPENNNDKAIRITSNAPVDFSPLCTDIYLAPRSFEWTTVFAHEPGYGPYFARASWREGGTTSL